MQPRVSPITLGVSDLERSTRFYRNGLGLPMRDGPEGIAFFETGSTWFSLHAREALARDAAVAPEGSGFRGFVLAHNVRTKAEVDATLEEAVAAGAEILKPAQEVSWGSYSDCFADPDGFLWEVAFNPHFWIE